MDQDTARKQLKDEIFELFGELAAGDLGFYERGEFLLWRELEKPGSAWPMTEEMRTKLKHLSEASGGWFVNAYFEDVPDDADEFDFLRFIPAADWQRLYATD